MQTFLPYSDFVKSARVLDYKRLGKQRVEGMQIINAIENPDKQGWQNHPITVMWRPHIELLKHYTNIMITEWIDRGYNNTMKHYEVEWPINLPDWLGYKPFHSSHRANLLRKDYEYYSQFNWKENPESPYVWRDKDKLWYEQMVNTGKRIYL